MIKAIIFDMDGTLVQNEKLKALSVAVAVQRLRGLPEPDPRGIEAYRDMVGSSREVVSRHIVDSLALEEDLRPLLAEYGASETWEVLGAMRRAIYDEMVADPQAVRDNPVAPHRGPASYGQGEQLPDRAGNPVGSAGGVAFCACIGPRGFSGFDTRSRRCEKCQARPRDIPSGCPKAGGAAARLPCDRGLGQRSGGRGCCRHERGRICNPVYQCQPSCYPGSGS